jgi:hypothetical protein
VFENRVLRLFGPKRDEMTGEWRKVHMEELRILCSSLIHIIRMIKPRRMRWAGNVARMEEKRNAWKSQREKDYWEDQEGGRGII